MSADPWRTMDLGVRRRIDSLISGDHEGTRLGAGSEPEEAVPYHPGDDVRRIDWNITARNGEPHVWRSRAEHPLDTWVLLDTSASMAFGTVTEEKRELAAKIVAAVALLTDAPGNSLGLATFGASHVRWHRPGRPRVTARRILRDLAPIRTGAGGPGLATTLEEFAARQPRPGLRVVVSDFMDPAAGFVAPFDWQTPLRRLAARHDVIAVEIVDPRELTLPDVGSVVLTDPESGRQRHVWSADTRLRHRYAEAAQAYRMAVATAIRGSGADHLPVSTGRDWVGDLARFIRARRRTRVRR
ncbi:DUF58 domain-containing protein [Mycolicibacterium bacteremicum]|uniref:DUF58 domain-containing protein n=1 Tax=Mycolicibacterium bacteremicum TaxID=564198 RepID=UPI0026EA2A73|nr:DUF58 domain-containing protein [Mycolicibacterium bacteremicum]